MSLVITFVEVPASVSCTFTTCTILPNPDNVAKVGGEPAPAEVRTWPEEPVATAAGAPAAS